MRCGPCRGADTGEQPLQGKAEQVVGDDGGLETLAPAAFATPLGLHPDLPLSTYWRMQATGCAQQLSVRVTLGELPGS